METLASKVSYKLLHGPTRDQTEADLTFRSGARRAGAAKLPEVRGGDGLLPGGPPLEVRLLNLRLRNSETRYKRVA